MKLSAQNFSQVGRALFKGVLLSACLCVAGFHFGRALHRSYVAKIASPVQQTQIAAPKLSDQNQTVARATQAPSELLASAADALPFVGVTELDQPAPKKHRRQHSIKKAAAKKVAAKKAPAKISEPTSELDSEEPSWVDQGLLAEEQVSGEDSDQAEDIYDATDVALQSALIEPELAEDFATPASVPWQFDQSLIANREIAAERVYGEIAGTYKKNDFSEIRTQLTTLSNEQLVDIEPSPESKFLAMENANTQIAQTKAEQKPKAEPEVISGTFVTAASPIPNAPVSATAAPQVFVDPSIRAEELKTLKVKPIAEPTPPPLKEEIAEEKSVPVPHIEEAVKEEASAPVLAAAGDIGPTLVSSAGAALATAGSTLSSVVKKGPPELVLPSSQQATAVTSQPVQKPVTNQPPAPQAPTLVSPKPVAPVVVAKAEPKAPTVSKGEPTLVVPPQAPTPVQGQVVAASGAEKAARRMEVFGPARNPDERLIDEKLFGEVLVDGALSKWLVQNKAHIELNLHPVASRDPQDTVYIDYQYPAADFSLDTREMRGAYRLLADIYTSKAKAPYAQVLYPKGISADTAKEKVLFRLSMKDVERSRLGSPQHHRAVALSSTIFEGASGDYRDPKAVTRGSVDVIGFPELGHIQTETDGTFRLPLVPGNSELLLHVQAEGYYPSFKVVPTFATDVYAPVYLIARDKVDVITRYFTHHLQNDGSGLLMGRVFDPKTRVPLADEQLALTYRRGAAVYFSALGALPIIPSASTLQDTLATTVNGMFAFFNLKPSVRALSRASGKASLLVNVRPQTADYVEFGRGGTRNLRGQVLDGRAPVPARVRLVGDAKIQVDTDAQGGFTLPDLDLPPGVLTLEIEAKGYPLTWHSVSWNPREPEGVHRLFLLDKDEVYGGAANTARVGVDSREGILIGQNSIFPKHAACVFVSLFDSNGKLVDGEQGPYSVTDAPKEGAPGLCLTRQKPWFSYFNLPAGEYVLKLTDQNSRTVRSHVVRVGQDRVAISAD